MREYDRMGVGERRHKNKRKKNVGSLNCSLEKMIDVRRLKQNNFSPLLSVGIPEAFLVKVFMVKFTFKKKVKIDC